MITIQMNGPNWQPVKLAAVLLLYLSFAISSHLEAQPAGSFISNGKKVYVKDFNKKVKLMMQSAGVPGMSLSVIEKDRISFHKGYGIRKLGEDNKVTRNTIFDGCSLSKSFLTYVVYQLVDEGRLDLDKPMYQYLENKRLAHDDRYRLITPRMVLSHSSGIENWAYFNNVDTLEIVETPGHQFNYSGEGYQYLAEVCENMLGKSYEEYVTQRVLKPLHLRNTYLKYKKQDSHLFHKVVPWNYAVGHQIGGQNHLYRSKTTLPAAGNHFTAEDYAKLILALVDKSRYLTNPIPEIVRPMVRINNSSVYYGPGFEVFMTNNDTIIAHGGDKLGFKNLFFYSIVQKRGFVFMTNSDRGKSMAAALCEMTAGLNIKPFLESQVYEQYPGPYLSLLNIFDKKGPDVMFSELTNLKLANKLMASTLNALGYFFRYYGNKKIARKVLEETIAAYPDSAFAYSVLGGLYLEMEEYRPALTFLTKAQELNFSLWDIKKEQKKCERELAEIEKRTAYVVNFKPEEETILQAENYNYMMGCKLQITSDEGGGQHIGYIDTGDWMNYKVTVPVTGKYTIAFRVSSLNGGSQLQVRSGEKIVGNVDIPATNAWTNWTSQTINVVLPEGAQTVTLFATSGGFTINWFKVTFISKKEQ